MSGEREIQRKQMEMTERARQGRRGGWRKRTYSTEEIETSRWMESEARVSNLSFFQLGQIQTVANLAGSQGMQLCK